MNYTRLRDILSLPVTPEEDFACRLLEERGYRFCVDYGYVNAVQMATNEPPKMLEDSDGR